MDYSYIYRVVTTVVGLANNIYRLCCLRRLRSNQVDLQILSADGSSISIEGVDNREFQHLSFMPDDIVLVTYSTNVTRVLHEPWELKIGNIPPQRCGRIPFMDLTIITPDGIEHNHELDLGQYRLQGNRLTRSLFARLCKPGVEGIRVMISVFEGSQIMDKELTEDGVWVS